MVSVLNDRLVDDPRLEELRERIRERREQAQELEQLPPPAECRAVRELAIVPQEVVAGAVGVTRSSIALYEAGLRRPRGEHLQRYLAALAVLREAIA